MQIRRYGPEMKSPLQRAGARGLSAAVIQLPLQLTQGLDPQEVTRRYRGTPIVLDRPNTVVALSLEPGGETDEHDAPESILLVVIAGSGFVRVGGPEGETTAVQAGDAVLWPGGVLHRAWTEDEAMEAIVFHYAPD